MELFQVLGSTFAAREFTNDPLPDATLYKILERARFAPSGGNRQGWRVIVVREQATRQALAELTGPAAKRYAAQQAAGENPWNPVVRTSVDAATIERAQAQGGAGVHDGRALAGPALPSVTRTGYDPILGSASRPNGVAALIVVTSRDEGGQH